MTKVKLHTSIAWLTQRYLLDKKSIEEMAIEAKVAEMTIRRALQSNGLMK